MRGSRSAILTVPLLHRIRRWQSSRRNAHRSRVDEAYPAPAIRRVYPLAEAAEVRRDLECRRTVGSIVMIP